MMQYYVSDIIFMITRIHGMNELGGDLVERWVQNVHGCAAH